MLAVINTPDDTDPIAIREAPEPSPAAGEALVAVDAFSVNRGELVLLKSRPAGWRPGQDIAGRILRPAADGSGPPAGARVVALVEQGGWAERVAARTDRMAILPDVVRVEDAAALPIPGLTALRALRRGGMILGKRVMITGATNGIGLAAASTDGGFGTGFGLPFAPPRRQMTRPPVTQKSWLSEMATAPRAGPCHSFAAHIGAR